MAGIAKPKSALHPTRNEVPQAKVADAPVPEAGPGVEAIGQIRYAAARDVDQGGGACGQQQSQSTVQSWDAYRRY